MKSIIPKKVSNYELFYDLVFVFAVSVLTGMMHGEGAHITFVSYLQFIIAFVMLIKLWYHETMYLNKYGERDLMDIVTIILNMFMIGYMAREMSLDWQNTYAVFITLFLLSNVSVLLQYGLRARKLGSFTVSMRHHMKDIMVDMGIPIIWYIWLILDSNMSILWTYLLIGLSSLYVYLTRSKKEKDPANFAHLVERVQLITIIYFGEAIIASIKAFDLSSHMLEAILSFTMIGLMFISYITQTAVIMNHHQQRTGLRLFYVHVGLLLGVLFTTLMIEMIENPHHFMDAKVLGLIGIGAFYLIIQFLAPYNKSNIALTKKWLLLHWGSLVILLALALIFVSDPVMLLSFGVLTGLSQFVIVLGRLPNR